MSVPPAIESALKRLASALDHLEAAAERQGEVRAARLDTSEEFAIMRDDRSRLAVEMDGALAHLKRLEQANDEALKRIDRASEAIRAALGDDDAEDAPLDETADDTGEA
jgi:chromosome segregation ATPase